MSYKDNHVCINHKHFINMIHKIFLSYVYVISQNFAHRYSCYSYFISMIKPMCLIDKILILYTNFKPTGKACVLMDASFRCQFFQF